MVRLYIYLPINDDPNSEGYVPPSIDVDGESIVKAMAAARDPNAAPNAGGHHGNQNTPELKAVSAFHKARKGWVTILAWSHGNSTKSMQDISLTKYCDQYSPILSVMVMTREVLPHAFLRVVGMPKEGKVNIIEYKFVACTLSSVSTGGSGGETSLTENITISFDAMHQRTCEWDLETGERAFDSRGAWNEVTQSGVHDGITAIATLQQLTKRVVVENAGRYQMKHLRILVKHKILNPQDVGLSKGSFELPIKGRRLLIAPEEEIAADSKRLKHFKEMFLKELTYPALLKAVAAKLKRPEAEVHRINLLESGDKLVEIDENDQVEDLAEGASLVIEFAPKK